MKRLFYNNFSIVCYLTLGAFLTALWSNTIKFSTEHILFAKIMLSCLSVLVIIIIEVFRPSNKTIIKKVEDPIIWRIVKLDEENDVYLLRDIQSVVKKKLSKSTHNKMIIQATKDLCGKNCKCSVIKKQRACTCGMFDEYVKYLANLNTEE